MFLFQVINTETNVKRMQVDRIPLNTWFSEGLGEN